jgi:hypothetical protein
MRRCLALIWTGEGYVRVTYRAERSECCGHNKAGNNGFSAHIGLEEGMFRPQI